MAKQGQKRRGSTSWVLRLVLWVYAVISVPLYLWFLHHMAGLWAEQLPANDNLRAWLPIVVPGEAFSFTLLAALSWWVTLAEGRPFLLGRTRWWFVIVFVGALSLSAGVIGAPVRGVTTVILTGMMTLIGMTGLWLLPPALSPRLLEALPRRDQPPARS